MRGEREEGERLFECGGVGHARLVVCGGKGRGDWIMGTRSGQC